MLDVKNNILNAGVPSDFPFPDLPTESRRPVTGPRQAKRGQFEAIVAILPVPVSLFSAA